MGFSWFYIRAEQFKYRFFLIVLAFIISIQMLIFSPNLVRVLVGWDGLGVSSYLLVVYYINRNSTNAGILTFATNRVGDALLVWTLIIMLMSGKADMGLRARPLIIAVLFIIAAVTKRAQIPFRSWLPAAMAAPTPVSALVHSSTLVTAGVYLLFRFSS